MNKRLTVVTLLEDNSSEQFWLLWNFLRSCERVDETVLQLLLIKYSEVQIHTRVNNYYNYWLPKYSNEEFFSLFRMSKQTFLNLLSRLNCEDKIYSGGEHPISIEQQLLMTLWWLGKGEVLLSVSDKFNVAISTVYNSSEFILNKIIELLPKFIVWPDAAEIIKIERDFQERAGFPGVIGAIDGCNIPFKAPLEQQESYVDRYLTHSIKLQGVVTCDKIFTNVMVGFPGSVHDSRVLRNSELYLECEERGNVQQYFYEDKHLVGDSAYPLHNWLMAPYRNNGNLRNIQRRYNNAHSVTRVVVEHTFGILEGRWRILHYINVNSVVKAVKVLTACCVLHNFCYVHDDFWYDYIPRQHDDDGYLGINVNHNAMQKRDEIANSLNI